MTVAINLFWTDFDDFLFQEDTEAPYSLLGDDGQSDYFGQAFAAGVYSLNVRQLSAPFSGVVLGDFLFYIEEGLHNYLVP